MSSKHQISYELPSSTTASDDIQEVENAEKRFRRPTTPLDSSEAEAAPSADREGRSSPSSYSLSCTASSGDISRVSDEFDSCSWSLKFHESKEVENGDPNESGNKHPPRLETPPFRPPSPFEIEMEEDSMDVPPNPGEHIQLSRAETDAIIDRLLSSCDGDFGDEFDDDFDPAVIKFEIEPEVKQPRVEGPITLYSEDEDESDNETKKPFKSQPIVVIDDDSDDEEVKIICSRQNANEVSVDRSVSRNELTSGRSMMGLGKRSILDDVEEENDVIFVPPAATKSCADTTTYFGDPGPSTSSGSRGGSVARHISRPSTSRAALKHTTAVRPTAPIPIKPEPTHSTTTMNDDISRSSHMTDYRIAFAEVEQLLTEDNERNRRFFSAPSPPPPDRGMFKNTERNKQTRRDNNNHHHHQSNAQTAAGKEEKIKQARVEKKTWRQEVKNIPSASSGSVRVDNSSNEVSDHIFTPLINSSKQPRSILNLRTRVRTSSSTSFGNKKPRGSADP